MFYIYFQVNPTPIQVADAFTRIRQFVLMNNWFTSTRKVMLIKLCFTFNKIKENSEKYQTWKLFLDDLRKRESNLNLPVT